MFNFFYIKLNKKLYLWFNERGLFLKTDDKFSCLGSVNPDPVRFSQL